MKKILVALAATSLVVAPVAAQSVPFTAPIEGEALGGEGNNATPIAIALIAGIVAIAAFAFSGGDDDNGVSP